MATEIKKHLKEAFIMAYGYITKLSENVERKHVRYNNRYGIAIAGDIYQAKDLDETKKSLEEK